MVVYGLIASNVISFHDMAAKMAEQDNLMESPPMKMYLNLFLTPVLSLLLWGNAVVAADKTDGVNSSIAVAKVI